MDKLKDILYDIRDRFSNPLIFSFIISWILFNWEISVALLWYDTNQLELEGYTSVFEFIADKLNKKYSLIYPLVFAFLYASLFKNLFKALIAFSEKWGEDWNLKILKSAKVSMEKYLVLRENYKQKEKELVQILNEESAIKEENTNLLRSYHELNQKNLKNEETIRSIGDVKFLNGYWECKYRKKDSLSNVKYEIENVHIRDYAYYLVKDFGNEEYVFDITNFYKYYNTIVFVKITRNRTEMLKSRYLFNSLTIKEDGSLVGTENGEYDIEYRRKTNQKTNEVDNASGDQLYPIY